MQERPATFGQWHHRRRCLGGGAHGSKFKLAFPSRGRLALSAPKRTDSRRQAEAREMLPATRYSYEDDQVVCRPYLASGRSPTCTWAATYTP